MSDIEFKEAPMIKNCVQELFKLLVDKEVSPETKIWARTELSLFFKATVSMPQTFIVPKGYEGFPK